MARRDTFGYRTAKFIQRNRLATAAALLILVSLIGGLFATTWEARRARMEKGRAERRFNDVRRLAHSVLFDYHDLIKNLPGATAARERLVRDALAYLDSLSREATRDRALQRELAAAYERVGDVRGEVYGASAGDMGGALDSYQKALQIREALVATDPHDVNNRCGLAEIHMKIGTQLQDTADAKRGLEYLRKSCALYQQLATEQRDNADIRDYLSRSYNELGMALQNWGNPAGALKNHREALRLRKELLAADPQNDVHRRHLAITYWDIGQALMRSGDINAALEANRNCLELSIPLFAENPTNIKDRGRVGISYQMEGEYRALIGDVVGALESFRKKLQIAEQNLSDDPANAQAGSDVAYSWSRIGELLAAKGDDAEALSQERKALDVYERLSADSPQNVYTRYQTAIIAGIVAKLEAKLSNRAQAVATVTKALGLLQGLPEDPRDAVHLGLRGQAYLHLGAAHAVLARSTALAPGERQEHWRAARDFFQRSLGIWQDMQQRGILTADNVPKLAEMVREVAECDAALTSNQ